MSAEDTYRKTRKTPEKSIIVLDASVLIKFIAKESGDEKPLARLKHDIREEKIDIAIPSLAYFEVGNWVARNHPQEATRILSYFMMCGFHEIPLDIHTAGIAVDIVRRHKKISFYDAGYHALAIRLSGTFLTADEAYVSETKKLGNVCLLSAYQAT